MQFSKATLVAVLIALVQAQSISDLVGQIPSCAVSCLTTAIAASGCGLTDYVCQCSNPGHNTILAKGAGCISTGCSTGDALTTTNVTNQICAIALAGGASSTAASVASSAASAASSAISSAASSASSASSAASAAGSTATSSAAAVATSNTAASSAASSVSSAATSAASAATSAASKASSSAAATATTNAGSGFKVGAGMMGAAVIAAIAL